MHIYYIICWFRIMFSQFSFWFSSFSSPIIRFFVVRWSYISFCVMQPEVMIKRRWGQLTDSDTFDFFLGGMFLGGRWWMWMWQFVIESKSCLSLTIDVFFSYFWSSQPWFLTETNDTKGGEEKPTQSSPKCQFTGRVFNAMRHWFEFLRLTGTLIPRDVRLT